MNLGRRGVVRIALLGGVTTIIGIPLDAIAAHEDGSTPLPPEQILGQLLSFGLQFLFGIDIPAPVIDGVIALFTSEGQKTGRATSVVSNTRGSSLRAGPGQAIINVGLHKSSSGLLVHGHMVDGGKMAFTHDGTAPSHTHPAMQQHAASIVGQAHGYLRASNR